MAEVYRSGAYSMRAIGAHFWCRPNDRRPSGEEIREAAQPEGCVMGDLSPRMLVPANAPSSIQTRAAELSCLSCPADPGFDPEH
jgi:hypothetical protein